MILDPAIYLEMHMSEDTPENQQKLEDLVNDSDNYLGTDKYGNKWYGQNNADGTQTWGTVRGDKITNGGINQTPKIYNPETGLSAPEKPFQ